MEKKKTLVLGASTKPTRYSYLAINRLVSYQHPVVAIGKRKGSVAGVPVQTDLPKIEDLDTVTLYLNAQHQKAYYDYIMSLKPRRIIFNTGAENDELAELAKTNQIEPIEACTLVMLSTGQY